MITYDKAHELFFYKEGNLYWKISPRSNVKTGAIAGAKRQYVTHGYKQVMIDGKHVFVHRIIFLMMNGNLPAYIDHKDGDCCNNLIENLRAATASQNRMNSSVSSRNLVGVKGVSKGRREGTWKSQICINGKRTHLGTFSSIEKAAQAYKDASHKYFGEFARQ
jgi:hypothetical protein